MSKIKCVHCGKTIDDSCKVCIYCRRKIGTLPDEVIEERIENISTKAFYIIIFFISILFIFAIGQIIFKNINENIRIKKVIKSVCKNSDYEKNKLNKIIKESDCESFIYYIEKNGLKDKEVDEIIKSNNQKLYYYYYKLKEKDIHTAYSKKPPILPKEYLDYLLKRSKRIEDDYVDDLLLNSFLENDIESFEMYTKLANYSNDFYPKIEKYFNYGDIENKDEEADFWKIQEAAKYSLIYHKNKVQNKCFTSDITTKENLEYLIKNNSPTICEYVIYSHRDELTEKEYNLYKDVGGKIEKYVPYFYSHASRFKYEELSKYIPIYISMGMDINTEIDHHGTILDILIHDEKRDCVSHKNGFSSIDNKYKENCEKAMNKYYLLKRYGAVCNKKCDDEKWLK